MGQGQDPGDSRARGSCQLHPREAEGWGGAVGGGLRVPGIGALLLWALATDIDRCLQNTFICGHGLMAGSLPPTWQGGGDVGRRKTRQSQGHTAGKMVGGFTPRSLSINTPEHLCARNWRPRNRGLRPCLQSRGRRSPAQVSHSRTARQTEAQVPRGALAVQGWGGVGGLSEGGLVTMGEGRECVWGVSSVRAGAEHHGRPRQGQGLGLVEALDLERLLGLFCFLF